MIYLVDANVLSEATKIAPAAKVVQWLRTNESEIAVDPIILGKFATASCCCPPGNAGGDCKAGSSKW